MHVSVCIYVCFFFICRCDNDSLKSLWAVFFLLLNMNCIQNIFHSFLATKKKQANSISMSLRKKCVQNYYFIQTNAISEPIKTFLGSITLLLCVVWVASMNFNIWSCFTILNWVDCCFCRFFPVDFIKPFELLVYILFSSSKTERERENSNSNGHHFVVVVEILYFYRQFRLCSVCTHFCTRKFLGYSF